MLSYSQWMEVTQKKKCENLLSLHTQPFLRDSCRQLKEIYYITSLLLISHYAHLFPVGGFRLQGLFLCLPQISSRLCSSVNCLNTEAGLRWCNLLPQHFSGWVLGSRCLFGPQTATRSSTSPPSLIVSDIDLMGWGTAAVLWNWMLLSLQQQDLMTLSDERELWDVVGYLDDLFLEIDI